MVSGQFKKMREQGEADETKRLFLENQLGELSKVITERTIGEMETNGRTMEIGVTKIGGCGDSGNLRDVQKSASGNRRPNLGNGRTKSRLVDQSTLADVRL